MENGSHQSLGGWLRATRESRGASLDEAANVTRIGKNYLQDLEDDQFDKLPSAAYAKGFLKLYANFLELPPAEVVSRYEQQLAGPESHREEPPAAPRGKIGANLPVPPWGRWGIPVVLLGTILLIAFWPGEKQEPVPVHQSAQSVRPAVVAPPPIQGQSSSAAASKSLPSPEPVIAPPEPAPAGDDAGQGVVLRLKVIQDTSLLMTIDGAVSQQYDLKAGDLIEWKAAHMFALELGNPAGVAAELNGAPLKSLGEADRPARLIIEADGVHPE